MLQITHGSTTTNDVYGRERLFAEQNGVRSWYANDALGSVRVTLNDTGMPSEPASYDPWGKGGSATFGFTGEFQDTTDLVYLRARWYDPRSATFISRDMFEGYAEQFYESKGSVTSGSIASSGFMARCSRSIRLLGPRRFSNASKAFDVLYYDPLYESSVYSTQFSSIDTVS